MILGGIKYIQKIISNSIDPRFVGKIKKITVGPFYEHISAPLSGQSWKTEIYRPKDLRPGTFSIPPFSCTVKQLYLDLHSKLFVKQVLLSTMNSLKKSTV